MDNGVNFKYNVNGVDVDFRLAAYLQGGAFARPQLCEARRQVVLKRIPTNLAYHQRAHDPRSLLNEAKILPRLCHRNIVRVYNTWCDQQTSEIVMELEYLPGGNLANLIDEQRCKNALFERDLVRSWLAQLSLAIAYIHNKGIIHRDLKPDNILLTGDKSLVKLADFGTAKFYHQNSGCEDLRHAVGTQSYMAPEMLGYDSTAERDNPKIDAWSLGVIAYEIATLELPYKPVSSDGFGAFDFWEGTLDLLSKFQQKWKPDPIDQVHFTPALQILIETKLLVIEQSERATIVDVLRDDFLAEMVALVRTDDDDNAGNKGTSSLVVVQDLQNQLAITRYQADAETARLKEELALTRRQLAECQQQLTQQRQLRNIQNVENSNNCHDSKNHQQRIRRFSASQFHR